MTVPSRQIAKRDLRLMKKMRKRKPNFVRSESWRYARIKENWRRPRGLDHKMRLKYDGWPPSASVGYKGPKATRGLHPSGFREILVYNVEGLRGIDPKTQVVRIAHAVGKRKKTRMLAEARKKKLIVLNLKEAIPKEEVAEKELGEEKTESGEAQSSEPEQKPDRIGKHKEETKQQ